MPARSTIIAGDATFGLRHWMEQALKEVERASLEFSPDAIHDLRVALRRCRSMAAGYMAIDSDRSWKAMSKEAKRLFKRLGALRDAQVMEDWGSRLGAQGDPVCSKMNLHLAQRRQEVKLTAIEALREFDREKWERWIRRLQGRARRIPAGGAVFQLSALNAWEQGHHLHAEALRNRSAPAYHRLRIGIKDFRYLIENFLPLRHQDWGEDLKALQDWLGEVQDLTVFWETAIQIHAFPDAESWDRWQRRIEQEKVERIDRYRNMMLGTQSLWKIWREGLPPQNRLPSLNLAVIQTWASFHGVNLKQARDTRRLALLLYDGLHPRKRSNPPGVGDWRAVVHAAALLYDADRIKIKRRDAKVPERLLQRLPLLPGFSPESLRLTLLVVHCCRTKLQDLQGADNVDLPEGQRQLVIELAGILRLAAVLVRNADSPIRKLVVDRSGDSIVILAENYSELGLLAEKVASARYLLEYSCKTSILIRNLPCAN